MQLDGVAAIVTGGASGLNGAAAAMLAGHDAEATSSTWRQRSAIANPMLNGETIRLDGAIRLALK